MDIVQQALAIAIVFALLGTALWMLRRKGLARFRYSRTAEPSLIASCGRLSLGPQHSVHVVRVGDRRLLLGVHPTGITHLGDLTAGTEAAKRT